MNHKKVQKMPMSRNAEHCQALRVVNGHSYPMFGILTKYLQNINSIAFPEFFSGIFGLL